MAKIRKGGGGLVGAIRGRTQFLLPNGHWAKRDARTGEVLSVKADKKPYKNVVREKPVPVIAKREPRPVYPRVQAWSWSVTRSRRPAQMPEPLPFPAVTLPRAA